MDQLQAGVESAPSIGSLCAQIQGTAEGFAQINTAWTGGLAGALKNMLELPTVDGAGVFGPHQAQASPPTNTWGKILNEIQGFSLVYRCTKCSDTGGVLTFYGDIPCRFP